MADKLRFHPAVPDDLVNALDYDDEISDAPGYRFREKANQRLDEIANKPEAFPFDIPPVRFAKIDRFPFLVFFAVEPEVVRILSIIHGASNPEQWRARK